MPSGIREIGGAGVISCSQLGALYGVGYTSKYKIYARYTGIDQGVEEFSEEAKKSMEFGTHFEDAVAAFFTYKTGLKVKKLGDGKTAYWRKDMPYFICHPDRVGVGRDKKGRRFALEIKCVKPTAEDWGDEWTAEVPDFYYLQDEGYFACEVPCDVVYMAVLKGNRVYFYEIEPDKEVVEDIIAKVKAAKAEFDNGIVPEPENYEEAIRQYTGRVNLEREGMPAGDEGLAIWNEMVANHKVFKDAEDKEKELKAKMIAFMEDCPAVTTADGKKIKILAKYTESHKSAFDTDALKKDLPEIYEKYNRENVSRYVSFSFPKRKKQEE